MLSRSLLDANRIAGAIPPALIPGALVIAYDVLGGVFAANGGGLPGPPRDVCYFGPDTVDWTALGAVYTTWLDWLLTGDLDGFYDDLRRPGWPDDVTPLPGDQGIHLWPRPWNAEGHDPARVSRRAVPINELTDAHLGVRLIA